jgi:hypothetical protein
VNSLTMRWRTGRKLGRTIYRCLDTGDPDDDELIGMMDTAEVAAHVVDVHNWRLGT